MIWMSMATRRRNLVLSSITRRMSSRGVPPARLKTPATSATRIMSAITSSSKGASETRQSAIVIANQKPRRKLKLKTRVCDMLELPSSGIQMVVESLKARVRELEERSGDGRGRLKCQICMGDYNTPLVSVQCWHVHCEECWLNTLVCLCRICNLELSHSFSHPPTPQSPLPPPPPTQSPQ